MIRPGEVIRVVLVDDEPPARRKLRHLLSPETDFAVAGEAASAAEAVEVLNRERPDVVFLDIQLPDATGFDVLAALEERAGLHVSFVTAYDDFALKAFEVHAIDYLLKPVEPSRFAATIERLRRMIELGGTKEPAERLEKLMAGYSRRLLIQDGGRAVVLEVARIDWIEAARNYACIHSGPHTYVMRSSLDSLASKLDPAVFRRINRSEIVNAGRIAELHPALHGDQKVRLQDGTELTWSRRYRTGSLVELERV
jgi:two-component system, LytTR family, response regulator